MKLFHRKHLFRDDCLSHTDFRGLFSVPEYTLHSCKRYLNLARATEDVLWFDMIDISAVSQERKKEGTTADIESMVYVSTQLESKPRRTARQSYQLYKCTILSHTSGMYKESRWGVDSQLILSRCVIALCISTYNLRIFICTFIRSLICTILELRSFGN
jgi:hypothetical protein